MGSVFAQQMGQVEPSYVKQDCVGGLPILKTGKKTKHKLKTNQAGFEMFSVNVLMFSGASF